MSELDFYKFIQTMERELYGNSSYLFAGETNLEPWEEDEEDEEDEM